MIEAAWMIGARGATIDRATGAVTLFSIVDGIAAAGFPVFVPLAVVVMLRRTAQDDEQIDAHLRISLNDAEMAAFPVRVDFQGALKTHAIFDLQGLVAPGPGNIRFSFVQGERALANYELTIQGHPVAAVAPAAQAGGNP